MNEVFLDTETTGLSFKEGHKIVEIACIETIDLIPTGEVFHKLINPKRSMPNEAFKIHGFSEDFLKNKETFDKIADQFLNILRSTWHAGDLAHLAPPPPGADLAHKPPGTPGELRPAPRCGAPGERPMRHPTTARVRRSGRPTASLCPVPCKLGGSEPWAKWSHAPHLHPQLPGQHPWRWTSTAAGASAP